MLGGSKDVEEFDLDSARSPRKIRAKGPSAHRLSGRPPIQSSQSSLQQWLEETERGGDSADADSIGGRSDHHLFEHGLVGQIHKWVRAEKLKRDARRARRNASKTSAQANQQTPQKDTAHSHNRRDSDESVDLDQLEQIIKESFPSGRRVQRKLSTSGRHRPSVRRLHRASSIAASSDTDFVDGDILVPSAEVVLDNSKTLSYKGGAAAKSTDDLSLTRETTASGDAWLIFKSEVLRVIHTLQLKGWRRVPLEMSSEISIERLSGALTNAVYVVSPPEELPPPSASTEDVSRPIPKRKPNKLLLRIYGPQVEHLIDREVELQILRRLARKHIGPRMLGTFQNGRFEEFFNAAPLNPTEMRNPDTSRHIAKRMRELHDGVELLYSEREDGPFVWRNWDKWLARVQKIVEWMDKKSKDEAANEGKEPSYVCGTNWAVFHDTLFKYRKWLDRQSGGRKELSEALVFAHNDTQYGNILRLLPSSTSPLLLPANSHKQLIVIDFEYANANTPGLEFANHFTEWCYNYHDPATPWKCNHTLYPTPEDQERFIRAYVRHRPDINVNSPKLEALDTVPESRAVSPYKTSTTPDPDPSSIQQTLHHARNPSSGTATLSPGLGPVKHLSPSALLGPRPSSRSNHSASPSIQSNISSTSAQTSFSDRSGAVSDSSSYAEWEEREIRRLMKETRRWRMANSAQWVAWGIVQAKIPGLPEIGEDGSVSPPKVEGEVKVEREAEEGREIVEGLERVELGDGKESGVVGKGEADEEDEEDEDEEFDYLSYARDRAVFFWGDALALGFVKESELPADVRRDVKRMEY
ncbi:kinase-like domain-containing protein [Elsinoe ampelina]|uniref:Kinase-like domain-containing protein n=1 Tax=Elsinoe ampelina TaxID=302913 RepID=A0A6A6GAT4_9PEZI|nr:kinase-like domain-containing protein [Elsinoe ampelina]